MRTFSVAVGLVAVMVVVAAIALLAASAPASCNHADAARTAGLYVQSADGYISVLGAQPGSKCAASGMQKLCAQAKGLIKKQPREANAIFTAMFSHEPEASRPDHKQYAACAEDGEKQTATSPNGGGSTKNGGSTTSSTTTNATTTSTSTTTIHGGGKGTTNVTVTVNSTVAAGRRGPKGDPGTPGRSGANGRNGANGANGRNGTTQVIVCPTTKSCGAG
jgi:hypothetical protein